MTLYNSKDEKKNVTLLTYYALDDGYISFDGNPLHNTTYKNVDVIIREETQLICDIEFNVNVIEISGQEPIECELIDYIEDGNDLIIKLCQDWG